MKQTRSLPIAIALALLLALPLAAQNGSTFKPSSLRQPAFRASVETITAAQLRDYLSFVASDAMEGRLTPSRGLDATALFIATLLSRWGVEPAGDVGTFFQEIVLKKEAVATEGTDAVLGKRSLTHGKDFLASPFSGTASGRLVFAGNGWFFKSAGIDPYEKIDPKGKIVILTSGGLPQGINPQRLIQGNPGEDWMDPASYARSKGAIGIVQIVPVLTQANPDALRRHRERVEGGSFYPEKLPRGGPLSFLMGGGDQLPTIHAMVPLVQALFVGEKVAANSLLMAAPGAAPAEPFELSAGKTLRFSVETSVEVTTTRNVVALVRGSDPKLEGEYVALGAHYDHSGTLTPAPGAPASDTILNGADDNGSGTVALLAMAEALAKAPRKPKRSILFVWHAGEEMGLWGSQYFTTFPTVPLDRVIAQLNIDMIGRSRNDGEDDQRNRDLSGPDELYVIGSKMLSTELGEISEGVNQAFTKMSFNYRYDDPKDPEQFFYRSDHIHYARKNVPIIFYFTGVHEDYHQPGDEVSKIDFAKYERVTRLIYATMWELAELKQRPKVDKELPATTFPF